MVRDPPCAMKRLIILLALVLAVLHQDFWNWDNDSLVFGFMPVGLAYHAGYSLAAVALWSLAIKFAWPTELEEWAESSDGDEGASEVISRPPR